MAIYLEAYHLLYKAKYNNENGMDDTAKFQYLKYGIRLNAGLKHAMTTK